MRHLQTQLFKPEKTIQEVGKKLVISTIAILLCITANAQVKKWQNLGQPGFSGGLAAHTSLAIDKNDTVYVAYTDVPAGSRATVMKYNGTSWQLVGKRGFSGQIINNVVLQLDTGDVPYIAYQDNHNSSKGTVMKFDGSKWVTIGNAFSTGQARNILLKFDKNNVPYVCYLDVPNGGDVTVMKYDGGSWSTVGGIGISGGYVNNASLAIDGQNTPYVSYQKGQVAVVKYNGTSWVSVDSSGINIGTANNNFLEFDSHDTLYFAGIDGNNSNMISFYKFNGTSWSSVGSPAFSYGLSDLAFDNNRVPYVLVKDSSTNSILTVMKFDGNIWANVGSAGFSSGGFVNSSIAFDKSNNPYVGYSDNAKGYRTTVVYYGDCPQVPNIPICAVVVDSITNKNVILWDTSNTSYVDSYYIYRDDNGSYKKIGTLEAGNNSFVDTAANPNIKAYSYKLLYLDSCERKFDIDSVIAHKTVRLVFNYLLGGKASISWNSYDGISNPIYAIMRSNNNNTYVPIASFGVSGSDTTYIDANPPSGSSRYRIDIVLTNPCNVGGANYNKITSNVANSWNIGVNDITKNKKIVVTPNPANNQVMINTNVGIENLSVYSITGQKLITEEGSNKKRMSMDVSMLPSGTYMLRVNGAHNVTFIKQ